MQTVTDDEIHERLASLEASMPLPSTDGGAPTRRRPSRALILGASVGLVLAFAGGVTAREIAQQTEWRSSGLFTPGGPLHCSDLQNMNPAKAAPLLDELGYRVLWQDEHIQGAPVKQTRTAPTQGYLTDGISKGKNLIIIVDDEPLPASKCE
ncbi:MAG: hypothetical protein KJ062_17270 [Thermoanaerobaculia bacterium]|nr:hypothetical protein [Thermoanaerobaculia bacterium]